VNQEFTAYIRSLGPGGEPPARESFTALLRTLRSALIHEMKRRSVWNMPPSFLGVYGGSRWTDGDLLEELLLHCYQFIFLERLAALRRQLQVRTNLDGLVFLNIRHFLYEAQRRHDPLGMRLFEITHAAVERLHREGTLHVLDGDPRLRNSTVLGFAGWFDPRLAAGIDLRPQVVRWCDALLPDLVTAWGKEKVVAELAVHIARLPREEVEVFVFRDLLQPLKSEVRARWWAPLGATGAVREVKWGEENGTWVPLVCPDAGFEERQRYAELLHCMGERLGGVAGRAKTKEYLRRLWLALRQWAAEVEVGDEDAFVSAPHGPDNKRLGEALGIPRARIPKLKETLGTLLSRCRDAVASPPSPVGSKSAAVRREGLRQATGLGAARITPGKPDDGGPRSGEIFLLKASASQVEWLLVEHDGAGELWWTAPLDDAPFLGRHDTLAKRFDGAEVRVRCGLGRWMNAALFQPEQRTGALLDDGFQDVLKRRQKPSASIDTADGDPEYHAWIESLQDAAPSGGAEVLRFEDRRRTSTRAFIGLLAALFAAAVVSFGLWSWSLERQLQRPILLAREATLTVRFGGPQRTLETFQVPAGEHYVGFRMPLFHVRQPAVTAYRLQILEASSRSIVWESDWTTGDEEILGVLPRKTLRDARYVLRLMGRDGGGREIWSDEVEIEIDFTP